VSDGLVGSHALGPTAKKSVRKSRNILPCRYDPVNGARLTLGDNRQRALLLAPRLKWKFLWKRVG
jgi:hypothetical protein